MARRGSSGLAHARHGWLSTAKLIQDKQGSRPKPLIIAVTGLAGDLARFCSRLEGVDHHLLKKLESFGM
jgi:hypothetical protein